MFLQQFKKHVYYVFFGSFDVFMHVFFKFFYKSVKNMFFMFFICKLMFLTSVLHS